MLIHTLLLVRTTPHHHSFHSIQADQSSLHCTLDLNTSLPRFQFAANALLHTVDINMTNIKEWAILVSGATSHFLVTEAPTSEMTIATMSIKVTATYGLQVQSTHTYQLAIPELPDNTRIWHIILGLTSYLLLSVVKLCNVGCKVSLTKIEYIVKYRGLIVSKVHKCSKTGLWMVQLDTRTSTT